ncbi:intersectin-1-like [Anneissia japonica]|uniref:intersectin-1-like n=1 Tax=Anneissia japonica TaxID=1529436 RepID=UPI0014257AAD|nr:intersectin-1-like [Anneissia japonica]
MSETEQKRQSRIHELLDTEKSYVDDMVLVVEVFKKPLEEQKRLTIQELGMLFVNWNELIQCNTKLLKAMLVRKTMSGKNQPVEQIGDILCEQLPHFTPYIRFCSCQLSASAMLQKKIDTDPAIKDYLRNLIVWTGLYRRRLCHIRYIACFGFSPE